MNRIENEKQWTEHMRDEAEAVQAQQLTAGSSHSPMAQHARYTEVQLGDAVRAAVAAERERCAALAEQWSSAERLQAAFGDFTEWELRAAASAARAVAGDIRRPAEPAPPGA